MSFKALQPSRYRTTNIIHATNAIEHLLEDGGYKTFLTLLSFVPDVSGPLAEDKTMRTIFAPSAKAFEKLDSGVVTKLGDPRNLDVVEKIVRFHVTEGKLSEEDIYKMQELITLEASKPLLVRPAKSGGLMGFGIKDDGFKINEARIVKTIEFPNCIIHEVDTLLNPVLLYRFLVW